jgi:hypothetical protein
MEWYQEWNIYIVDIKYKSIVKYSLHGGDLLFLWWFFLMMMRNVV